MAFSLHSILGKYEFAIAFNKTEEEQDEPTSVVSETELAFGFSAPDTEDEELPEDTGATS